MLNVKRRLLSLNFAILMLLSVILPAGAVDITSQDQTETHQYEQYIIIDGMEYDATENHSGDGWEYTYSGPISWNYLNLVDYHGTSIISNKGLCITYKGNNTISGLTYGIYTESQLSLNSSIGENENSHLSVTGQHGCEAVRAEKAIYIDGDLEAMGSGCSAIYQSANFDVEKSWPYETLVGDNADNAVEGEYTGQQYISLRRRSYQMTLHGNGGVTEDGHADKQIIFTEGNPGYFSLYPNRYVFDNMGKVLVGWSDTPRYSEDIHPVDEEYKFAENAYSADLYAVWDDTDYRAVILYHYYGTYAQDGQHRGDKMSIAVRKGNQYILPDQTRSGCRFDGWLGEDGATLYPAGSVITVDHTISFLAQFTSLNMTIDGNEYNAARNCSGQGWKYYSNSPTYARLYIDGSYSGSPIELQGNVYIDLRKSMMGPANTSPIVIHGNAEISSSSFREEDDSSAIVVSGDNAPAITADGDITFSINHDEDLKFIVQSNQRGVPAIKANKVRTVETVLFAGLNSEDILPLSAYSDQEYVEFRCAWFDTVILQGESIVPTASSYADKSFVVWRNATSVKRRQDDVLQEWFLPGDIVDAGKGMLLEASYINNNRTTTAFIIDGQGGKTPSTSHYFLTAVSTDHLQAYSWPDNPFVYTGKTFIGYNTASDGSGTMYQPGEKLEASNLVQKIYAQWKDESSGGGASGGSTSGGGGDGAAVSTSPNNEISASAASNGKVSLDKHTAKKDDTVTITVTPDAGYKLEQLTVTDAKGNTVAVSKMSDGKYTFIMPASGVEIKAEFTVKQDMLFADVKPVDYFYDAVQWAVENGITNGVSDTLFNSDADCTRAQAVTFLWRAAGAPEPEDADSFTDVPKDSYYAKAAAWAVENGIASGVSATEFAPDAICTRAQIVTFLWRAEKAPAVDAGSAFTDVESDAYYADAVQWALKNGVTNGTSASAFNPDASCTRAQIVTFLWRTLAA